MKLSTRTRYGLRLLLGLAVQYQKGFIQLHEIAHQEEISEKYLEQIVRFLKSANLVQSQRGAQGGYTLSKAPSQINLKTIVEVLEGSLAIVDCVETKECTRIGGCVTFKIWQKLSDNMKSTLEGITLENLVEDYKKNSLTVNYEI